MFEPEAGSVSGATGRDALRGLELIMNEGGLLGSRPPGRREQNSQSTTVSNVASYSARQIR